MKKKWLVILPLVLIVIGVGVCFFVSRSKPSRIYTSAWNGVEKKFELCNIETTYYATNYDGCFFIPKDEEAFLELLRNHEGYLGEKCFSWVGSVKSDGHLIYYDNGFYAVMRSGGDYLLTSCDVTFSDEGTRYNYPSPGKYYPEDYSNGELNDEGEFDAVFGTFEDALFFYGYYDDETVEIDMNDETITVAIYDLENREISKEKKIVIDFGEKTVTELDLTGE